MAQEFDDRFVIPDAQDAVPLVKTIENMRVEIHASCRGLYQQARKISTANKKAAMRLKTWEDQINEIRESTMATSNLERLGELKDRCKVISQQLEVFDSR